MLYKIKQILHTGTCGDFGTERTDGRYPKRIGRVVEIDSNKLQVDLWLLGMFGNQMGHLSKDYICLRAILFQ